MTWVVVLAVLFAGIACQRWIASLLDFAADLLVEIVDRLLDARRVVRRGRPDGARPRRVRTVELDLVDHAALPWLSGGGVPTSGRAPREAARVTHFARRAA